MYRSANRIRETQFADAPLAADMEAGSRKSRAKARKLGPDDAPARARAEDGMQGAAAPSPGLQVRVRQSNGVEVERVAKVVEGVHEDRWHTNGALEYENTKRRADIESISSN